MEIVAIKPFEQSEIVEAIALVYQQSFGGEPWNEGYICPVCEKVFARTLDIKTCTVCAKKSKTVLVVERWPISRIISDFYREMMQPDSICVVAQFDAVIIGFAWGYRVSANPHLDTHLDARGLHHLLQGDFFYLDDCALVPAYQGKGIGKRLVNHIFREQQQKRILLRTKEYSRMCGLIKLMGGEIIKKISGKRVIMKLTLTP